MAEILVLMRTDALTYEREDIIAIKPDGWKWGREEAPPKFKVIRVPGVSENYLIHLLDGEFGEESAKGQDAKDNKAQAQRQARKRRYQLNVSGLWHGDSIVANELSARVRDKLNA